ncbi:GNAT family N-acetyltransferase [Bacillus sp. JJ722]|uniref:GNAT family N-acetyltransferase n=1 Tax=Bacillus sp. JJ722 TaxID=3122973 RepID=UPI002FFE925C
MKGGEAVISQGVLSNGQTYTVKKLAMEHITSVLSLQETVVVDLDNPSILQPLEEEEFRYILSGNGLMIGVFVDHELIAFRALLVPYTLEDHLGIDAGLPEKDLNLVIYQDISNVHPHFRGMSLQRSMASWIMDELNKQEHSYKYILATVAPFNIASLKDKFSQGMEIVALKPKYGGNLRYVFMKQLDQQLQRQEETVFCEMSDTIAQQQLLNEGYRGQGIELLNGKYYVIFGKNS